mgnify:CR=1 FL=1
MVDYPCTTYDADMIACDRRTGHTAAMQRAIQARLAARQAAYYTRTADDGAVGRLGNKALADAQREADGDNWIRRICGGAR